MPSWPSKLGFYLKWAAGATLRGRRVPLNGSLILTDRCNLHCRHCCVAHLGYPERDFAAVQDDLRRLYATGARMLVLTGGEPFVWRDADGHALEDVVAVARAMGFFRIVICTNGTFPLASSADYLWVSLDGAALTHDARRGPIHSQVVDHIGASTHRRIFINFTISTDNWTDFPADAEAILALPKVRGILFHLFVPYRGADPALALSAEQRAEVLRRLTVFKRRHPWRTFNTFAGLAALRRDRWTRPIWGSVTINGGELTTCCCRNGIADEAVCRDCGCSPAVETWVLQTLKLTAILENLRWL